MPPFVRSAIAIFSGFMVMSVILMFKPLMLSGFSGLNASLTLAYLASNAAITFVAVGFGGYVTAFVARYRTIEHGAALGGIVFLLNWLAYRHYSGAQPIWYIWFMGCVPPFIVLTTAAFYKEKAPRQTA